jgi:ribosomal protein L37AE/L43A
MTQSNYYLIISTLNSYLSEGDILRKGEVAHHCPFCGHHKKKLQINIPTGKWHCWVCNARGSHLTTLLRKLNASHADISSIHVIYDSNPYTDALPEPTTVVELPPEFTKVIDVPSNKLLHRRVLAYLRGRGITLDECIKYNIGYANGGAYHERLIIPSYDSTGQLNYFTSRILYEGSFKYKNPDVSKNIIIFDSYIDWKSPIVLVEGVFDAIAIRRNAIPIMGKYIMPSVIQKIIDENVKEVSIMLDADAINDSISHVTKLMSYGIKVKHVIPNKKDASDMGYDVTNTLISNTKYSDWESVIYTKIHTI